MYDGYKVIDVHGHMSTPPDFRAYAYNLIALRTPGENVLEIPDERMRPALDRHLKMLDERRIDVQMVSARPIAMMHWERPFLVHQWTRTTNSVIDQHCRLHPDRFVGVAQLPQNGYERSEACLEEFERCVKELGFVAALVNPDPAGDRQTPGMNDAYWFPLYDKAQELQAPLIVHPSISKDPRIEILPHSYQYNNLTEETLATLLLEHSDVFERFPRLRIVVCHCGGALRRLLGPGMKKTGESGGQVGLALRRREETERDVSENLFFDTCAYDRDFLATAIKQRGPRRMLFGTEAPGTGTAVINPDTARPSDDMIPVLDSVEFLTADDKRAMFHDNACRIFPLLKGV